MDLLIITLFFTVVFTVLYYCVRHLADDYGEYIGRSAKSKVREIPVVALISLIASFMLSNWVDMWEKAPFNQPVVAIYSDKFYDDTVVTTHVKLSGKSKKVSLAIPSYGTASWHPDSLCLVGKYVAVGASFKIRYRIWWTKSTWPNGKVKYDGFIYLDHPYSCDSKEKRQTYLP